MTCRGCDAALNGAQNCRPADVSGTAVVDAARYAKQHLIEKRKRKSYGAGNRGFREPPRDPKRWSSKEVFRLSYNDIMGQTAQLILRHAGGSRSKRETLIKRWSVFKP